MKADDPAVFEVLRRCKVARIATLSHAGRPSITPLYFVCLNGQIWLGTADWTLAARNVKADPRVSLLFEVERNRHDRRIVRIAGRARVRTDRKAQRSYVLRVVFKYSLRAGQIRNTLEHRRLILLRRRYRVQSAEKGQACVIEVIPEQAQFLI
jgi:nitroimidazol reductase NimA-like FMN-containing flavoprotein (pyridoxamine 5'-phosphate oxidase superfamily)